MTKSTIIFAVILTVSAISLAFTTKNSTEVLPNNEVALVKENATLPATDNGNAVIELTNSLIIGLDLEKLGLKSAAVEAAVKGYLKLKATNKLQNPDLLTIVDMSQSGRKKRFYLIDVKNQKLLVNTFVSHGMMSGLDMASDFSNTHESNKTSLGFYVTKGTYAGKHGLSMRMAGLEAGFNDNAEARGIVVHAADYVNAGRVNSAFMGRSQGCPALSNDVYLKVINLIKGGSAFFIYSPQTKYLQNSPVLNS